MDENRAELLRALQELGLPSEQARFCDTETAEAVVQQAKAAFVQGDDPRWWWTSLKVPNSIIEYPEGDGFRHLLAYVPCSETRCWLIVESQQDGPWLVLDVAAEVVGEIIGECYAFEYYLVGKNFGWLVGETHHNELIAVPPCAMT